jgi:hypothetical protein
VKSWAAGINLRYDNKKMALKYYVLGAVFWKSGDGGMFLKYFIVTAFGLHGLAHLSGFFGSWLGNSTGFNDEPWVLSDSVQLTSPIGRAFGFLWLITSALLVGSAVGIFLWPGLWPVLPIIGCVISLFVIVPWWNTVPPGARFGALFDLGMLAVLLSPLQLQLIQAIR